jgi:uncharacterized Tic20 family protein
MDLSLLQNADIILIGSTLIPVAVQQLKKALPDVKAQLLSFVVAFLFAFIVEFAVVGITGSSVSQVIAEISAIAVVAWRWADGTYRVVKPVVKSS